MIFLGLQVSKLKGERMGNNAMVAGRTGIKFLAVVALVSSSLVLNACVTTSSAPMTADEQRLRQQKDDFNLTVGEGAVAGAVLGGLIGAFTGGRAGALIGTGIGALAGAGREFLL